MTSTNDLRVGTTYAVRFGDDEVTRLVTLHPKVVFAHEQCGAQTLPVPRRLAIRSARPADFAGNGPFPAIDRVARVEFQHA